MGNAFEKLYSKPGDVNIIMVGLDGAGKTTLLRNKLKLGEITTTTPAPGFDVETVTCGKDNNFAATMTFTSWDLNERSDSTRPLWRHYYQKANCLVYLVDACDRGRVDEARDQLHQMLAEDELRGVPLLVMANKNDLPGHVSKDEMKTSLGLKEIKGRGVYFESFSAAAEKIDLGVHDALDWLQSAVHAMQDGRASKITSNV